MSSLQDFEDWKECRLHCFDSERRECINCKCYELCKLDLFIAMKKLMNRVSDIPKRTVMFNLTQDDILLILTDFDINGNVSNSLKEQYNLNAYIIEVLKYGRKKFGFVKDKIIKKCSKDTYCTYYFEGCCWYDSQNDYKCKFDNPNYRLKR